MRIKLVKVSAIVVAIFFLHISVLATPWTPIEWQDNGKLRDWVRDQNHNFVDDLIENETGQMTVIVDLNQCIGNPPENSGIIRYVKTMGDIAYIDKFISSFIATGIDAHEAMQIAARPEVAMVELATSGIWTQYMESAKIQSGFYSPTTLQDALNWPGTLNGNGINVALLDTGVSTKAEADYHINYVDGYDTETKKRGNPNGKVDDHGDFMASWIFGVAPGAGLIDIRIPTVIDPKTSKPGPDLEKEEEAIDFVLNNYEALNINVVSQSYTRTITDYKDYRSQKLSYLAAKGVVVVGAAGSNEKDAPVTYPGVARGVIAVSAADIHNSVNRNDDTATFVKGGSKATSIDDLKPEIVAPIGGISEATAMTAGLVALILQQNSNFKIFENSVTGSVKDLLIRGAEPKGAPETTFSYPGSSPTWNSYWGFGEIDAFNTFQILMGGRTDLTFKGFDGSAHPNDPWYYSHAIRTDSELKNENIQADKPDKIYARIFNNGATDAQNVRVSFGFYDFTAGIKKFYNIRSEVIPLIKAQSTKDVSIDWTPPRLESGEHGCIEVTIDYGLDTDYSHQSNVAQKNVRIEQASSPAIFSFEVENTLPSTAIIDLKVDTDYPDWNISLSQSRFIMELADCPKVIQAIAEPPANAQPGAEALFFITANATPRGAEESVEIGGVALKAIVAEKKRGGNAFEFKDWGIYSAERYFSGYVDGILCNISANKKLANGELSRILIDNALILNVTSGESIKLEQGYELSVKEIDSESKRIYLELIKDGKIVDSKVVTIDREGITRSNTTYTYSKDLGGAKSIVILAVHFNSVGKDFVIIDGIWQISDELLSIQKST